MGWQLKLGRISVAIAADFCAIWKSGAEGNRNARGCHDRSPFRMLEAENNLRRRDVLRFIELPLKYAPPLDSGLLRVSSLSLTKCELIGYIGGQIPECGQHNCEFRLELKIARAPELVIETKPRLRNARVCCAVTNAAKVRVFDHVRHGRGNKGRQPGAKQGKHPFAATEGVIDSAPSNAKRVLTRSDRVSCRFA